MVSGRQRKWFSRKAKQPARFPSLVQISLTVDLPAFLKVRFTSKFIGPWTHAIKTNWLELWFFSFLLNTKTKQKCVTSKKSSRDFWCRAGFCSVQPGPGQFPQHRERASQLISHDLPITHLSFYSHFLNFYFHRNPTVWINPNVGIFQQLRWAFLFESEVFSYCLRLLLSVIYEFLWNFINAFNLD